MKRIFIFFFLLLNSFVLVFGGYFITNYVVRSGDTLYDIARKFHVSVCTILDWNSTLTPSCLRVNQEILIPQPDGVLYTVKSGDNLYTIAKRFFTTVEDLKAANDLSTDVIRAGSSIFVPVSCIGKAFNKEKSFLWPVYGVFSSPYGWRIHPITHKRSFHTGIDIAAPEGTPVFSSSAGIVTRAGEASGYGLMVEIKSGSTTVRYAHLSRISVYTGQWVEEGFLIGRVGNTGVSTGPHLHFEVLFSGKTANPLSILPPLAEVYALKDTEEGIGGK